MRKKFLAMYALAGALVASPIFTSCVDDSVSDSVEALRGAKVEALKAQAAYDNALAQAALIDANANAALKNAQAEYQKADAAYQQALAKEKELINQITEGRLEADLAAAIADAEAAKLEAEQALAIAKINAEKALELAKWKAQQEFWTAEKTHAQQQAAYEKFLVGLDNEDLRQAENINNNINAILNGGAYSGWNTSGNWSSIRNYSSKYSKGSYNSINALIAGLVTEKAALISLENGLVDLKEYIAGEKQKNDETIATQTALIKKYTELQADATNREAMEKAYEEAKEKQYDLYTQYTEKQADAYNANMAYLTHMLGFFENEVQDYINEQSATVAVASDDEAISGEDSEAVVGVKYLTEQENEGSSLPLYTYTAEDAADLAQAIAKAKEAVDAEDVENARDLAIKEAELTPLKKQYDEIIASEGYKAALKELEDAVAEAKAAFDKTPNTETKEALEEAEEALATFDYSLVAEEEEETEGETETVAEGEATEDEEAEEEVVYETLSELKGAIEELEGAIEELKNPEEATEAEEALKKLEELQTLFTGDAMKEYTALCEEALKLEAANNALAVELATIKSEWEYCGTLMSQLEVYIGENGILPDYEAWIETAEAAIKEAERANEALAYGDNNNTLTGVEGENEAAQEKLIADKKAEIAAMEAELETRKAEYDAEVAALKALIGGEEE